MLAAAACVLDYQRDCGEAASGRDAAVQGMGAGVGSKLCGWGEGGELLSRRRQAVARPLSLPGALCWKAQCCKKCHPVSTSPQLCPACFHVSSGPPAGRGVTEGHRGSWQPRSSWCWREHCSSRAAARGLLWAPHSQHAGAVSSSGRTSTGHQVCLPCAASCAASFLEASPFAQTLVLTGVSSPCQSAVRLT
jgi:hypothetical protein